MFIRGYRFLEILLAIILFNNSKSFEFMDTIMVLISFCFFDKLISFLFLEYPKVIQNFLFHFVSSTQILSVLFNVFVPLVF